MKQISFRVLISVITFAVGITICWQVKYEQVTSPPRFLSGQKLKFIPTIRGDGDFGYAQFYKSTNGHEVVEGAWFHLTNIEANAAFNKAVSDALYLIEFTSEHLNKQRVGKRVVLVNRPNQWKSESVSILFYDGGQIIEYIEAPSLQLAYEFEKHITEK